MIHSHHEKYDGSGYPQGLKGEEIPIGARIISIVDAYDAMTNQRIHRNPKSHLEAIAELHELAGTCYDPQLVDLFEQCF